MPKSVGVRDLFLVCDFVNVFYRPIGCLVENSMRLKWVLYHCFLGVIMSTETTENVIRVTKRVRCKHIGKGIIFYLSFLAIIELEESCDFSLIKTHFNHFACSAEKSSFRLWINAFNVCKS